MNPNQWGYTEGEDGAMCMNVRFPIPPFTMLHHFTSPTLQLCKHENTHKLTPLDNIIQQRNLLNPLDRTPIHSNMVLPPRSINTTRPRLP